MNGFIKILIAIFVFGLLVFFHELGHFITAKLNRVKVTEFAIGMGPKLFQFGKGETLYTIRLLPIGGFTSMDEDVSDTDDPRAYCNKKVWQRILIAAAGSIMNIIFGGIILFAVVSMSDTIATTQIYKFADTATSSAVLQEKDVIKAINGSRVRTDNDIIFQFMRDEDGLVDITVEREGKMIELSQVPFQMEDIGDGVKMIKIDFWVYSQPRTFINTLYQTGNWTISMVKQIWTSVLDLITGRFGLNQLSGPVSVVNAIGEASGTSLRTLLLMVAFISINLGVFNLLPLPALDGGRLLFMIVELFRGKPIKPEYEGYVHAAGFILLIGLMIVVTFNDIMKLFAR